MLSRISSGAAYERMMNGKKSSEQNRVFSNNTGMTALSFKAAFLKTSYPPNKRADRNANDNHMMKSVSLFFREQR